MMNARSKNVGWRLDYFLLSHSLLPALCDSKIRSKALGSGHCPITLYLALAKLQLQGMKMRANGMRELARTSLGELLCKLVDVLLQIDLHSLCPPDPHCTHSTYNSASTTQRGLPFWIQDVASINTLSTCVWTTISSCPSSSHTSHEQSFLSHPRAQEPFEQGNPRPGYAQHSAEVAK
ncbi:hypothetical protein GH733_010005, partial [Mirounga leonina]